MDDELFQKNFDEVWDLLIDELIDSGIYSKRTFELLADKCNEEANTDWMDKDSREKISYLGRHIGHMINREFTDEAKQLVLDEITKQIHIRGSDNG